MRKKYKKYESEIIQCYLDAYIDIETSTDMIEYYFKEFVNHLEIIKNNNNMEKISNLIKEHLSKKENIKAKNFNEEVLKLIKKDFLDDDCLFLNTLYHISSAHSNFNRIYNFVKEIQNLDIES